MAIMARLGWGTFGSESFCIRVILFSWIKHCCKSSANYRGFAQENLHILNSFQEDASHSYVNKCPVVGVETFPPHCSFACARCPWCWTASTDWAPLSTSTRISSCDPASAMLPLVIHKRVVITVGGGDTWRLMTAIDRLTTRARACAHTQPNSFFLSDFFPPQDGKYYHI